MTDLSKLSPAVREAFAEMDLWLPETDENGKPNPWQTIRAELSRLSAVEAELQALRERIAASPVGTCAVDAHPWLTVDDADLPDEYEGQRVRLVREQEG